MTSTCRTTQVSVMLSVVVFAWVPGAALSATPGEIPKPWTYEGSMQLQQQPQQQRQQGQLFQQQPQTRQNIGNAQPGGAAAAAVEAARRNWQKKPALPPDRNPLLGRWSRPASTR